jgi:hypothetical protein
MVAFGMVGVVALIGFLCLAGGIEGMTRNRPR